MKDQLLSIAEANNATSITEKLKGLNREEYKTSVAFLGEFSSGKTTLINALLRKQFLPSFDKPTTAIITEITKGVENRFCIVENNNGSITSQEIEASEIAEEVQKGGKNRLLKVEVKDSELLDENTVLIDTPGLRPFCPPGLRLDFPRRLLVFLNGSWEGGMLLLPLFFGFSYFSNFAPNSNTRSLSCLFSFLSSLSSSSTSFNSSLSVKIKIFNKNGHKNPSNNFPGQRLLAGYQPNR